MYSSFASFYDVFTENVEYKKRADYVCRLFKKYGKTPTLLLDAACGTGSFSVEFAKRGISVIGADISSDMLSVANDKKAEQGLDILLINSSLAELDLYGTVDGAVCLLDSLNHITDYRELSRSIKRISLFLEKDSLFIFDVNTEYKHEKVLADNTFVIESENVYCVWQNKYNAKRKLTDITLDFFEGEEGAYTRYTEEFSERAYTDSELEKALKSAGLEILAVLGENTFKAPKNDCQRKFYVTRKI